MLKNWASYRVVPVNIRAGEQFRPEFLAISPNNRIPAIVDHRAARWRRAVFRIRDRAILIYLADKAGRFCRARCGRARPSFNGDVADGGLGPMLGQHGISRSTRRKKSPMPSRATATRRRGFMVC